jgi:hypothetical protein
MFQIVADNYCPLFCFSYSPFILKGLLIDGSARPARNGLIQISDFLSDYFFLSGFGIMQSRTMLRTS